MATRTVTFEVETSELFDMLAKVNGETQHIGARLVATLMAPPSWADQMGMACYGIKVKEESK